MNINKKKLLYIITIGVLVAAFGISAFLVGDYLISSKQESDRYEELANMTTPVTTTTAPTVPSTTTTPDATVETTEATVPTAPTEPQILPQYQERYNLNNDMVGHIWIDGTKLDYPVLQTPETKDYYLYRNFDKKDSKWGAIYAWEKADINEPSDNITIFGHKMSDGSMFACLHDYIDKKTWENNPWIFFNTLYEEHTYKIFAVFKTTAADGLGFPYHRFTDAADEAEFNEFVKTCKDLSFYDTGITPKYGDKLICLSTCEYTDPYDNGRLVVAAVRWS